jgi:hypothetical protein
MPRWHGCDVSEPYLEVAIRSGTEHGIPPKRPRIDIFRSIIQAHRQVDLLLDRPFAPSDAFQQVTLAVGYAAQLRPRFRCTRMPEPPVFAGRKRPADVYHRLVACFAWVRAIMEHAGLDTLTLNHHPEMVTPSDVVDIASLIVSELSFLHDHLDSPLTPLPPTIPDANSRRMCINAPGCSRRS